MPDHIKRFESMLFNYETTSRTDFRDGEIKPPVKTVYKEKPTCMRIRPPRLKDIHALTEWKVPNVPFDLFLKPKEIVQTDPRNIQQPYEKSPDPGRELAQKTRPRLVMTPAVSMDDIEDPKSREILVNDMYTSGMSRALGEAVSPCLSVRAPLPGTPAPANPIVLSKPQPPYVSPEWRMDSVSWDVKQLRAYTDPTKEFWIREKLPKCRPCAETAAVVDHRKMIRHLKSGRGT